MRGSDVVTFRRLAARCQLEPEVEQIMILRIAIGAVVGGGLGFAFYRLVGCSSGTCPLTSSPWLSTLYGMVLGALVASSFN